MLLTLSVALKKRACNMEGGCEHLRCARQGDERRRAGRPPLLRKEARALLTVLLDMAPSHRLSYHLDVRRSKRQQQSAAIAIAALAPSGSSSSSCDERRHPATLLCTLARVFGHLAPHSASS